MDGDGGLLVGRRLGGDALQPKPGRRQRGQERSAALGGEADQLVTEARDERQQQHAAQQFHAEAGERNQRVNHHRNHHHHHQEAGAAARMEGGERLRVLHVHRLAGFEIEDHLMLGAVILEHAVNVLHARDREQERQEDGDADEAVGGVEGDAAFQHRIPFPQRGDGVKRHELIKEDERTRGKAAGSG